MAELQQALNRNDMPAAHRLLAQLDSSGPISQAEASTLARQAVDSIGSPASAAEVATSPAAARTAPTVSVQMGDITRVPADSYQGVTVDALVNALVNGDPNAAGVVSQIKAAADGGDQAAVAFLQKADARILEVQAQARQAAEALVAGATPEQLASARALVSKAQAGDMAEIQQKLEAAKGGDQAASHMLQLVDAVAILDANQPAPEAKA